MKNEEQIKAIGRAMNARMSEFFDDGAFVAVGFIDGEPVIIRSPANKKTNLALNMLLVNAAQSMNISEDGDAENKIG